MFFILPIAHEQSTGRRWPIVSMLLVILCVLVFIAQLANSGAEERANKTVDRAAQHLVHRSYLTANCHALDALRHQPTPPPSGLDEEQLEQQQAEMNALCDAADRELSELPAFRFGDIPGRPRMFTLVTHQFLHGGFLHIIFNMWFLWLASCNLEDRWGRPLFLGFYLLSGVAGALLHRFMTPSSFVPLIGASGAIAGAMGAFLVILASTKIRFLYAFIFIRPKFGTFEAPAYVMLPLWFATEILDGLISQGDGTAHWAHVGGFVFGAVVAGGMKLSKLDEKLDSAIDQKTSVRQDAQIMAAAKLLDEGRIQEGVAALDRLSAEQPSNIDIRLELLRASTITQDSALRARALVDLALLYLEQGIMTAANDLLAELHQLQLYDRAPPERLLRLGERLAQKGNPASAGHIFMTFYKSGFTGDMAVRGAAAHAAVLIRGGFFQDARRVLESARDAGVASPEASAKIAAQLAQLDARIRAGATSQTS